MTREERHRRANEEQIRMLSEEVYGRPVTRRPAWLAGAAWTAGVLVAIGIYAALHLPVLPLLLYAGVAVGTWTLLDPQGWPLPARFGASLVAGLLAASAVWRP